MAHLWSGLLASVFLLVNGQIRVLTPEWLVNTEFKSTHGRIQGSTATFGAPFYGDRVLGKLAYAESDDHNYCTEESYDVPPPDTTHVKDYEQVKLINIVMVRRGKCSFVTKVRIAEAKHAHAVVIVDREDSNLTSDDLQNIVVADDGFGDTIRIPSVLISKFDGQKLIDAVKRDKTVVVELSWDIPTNKVVQVDLWMSSASRESLKFLKDFSSKRRTLNQVVNFQPHYAVFGMDDTDPQIFNKLCWDSRGQFCAEDPDGNGPVTGRDVLEENVRQLCIHKLTKVRMRQPSGHDYKSAPVVEYAREFWDYIERLPERCSLDVEDEETRFGRKCSLALMKEVGIDVDKVEMCADDEGENLLQHERENQAWSPRALRINGWRYSGLLDADLVTRAICSGFTKQPNECSDLVTERDPTVPFVPQTDGVSFGTLIRWLFITCCVAFVVLLLYKRYLKKEMRITLREEVMLEVQAQMGEYSKLQGNG